MTIAEQLSQELTAAMKAQDAPRRDVIRQVQTEAATARSQADFHGEADDDFYQGVIASYVKKMDKSRREYEEMGERGKAMAEKLAFEVDYLSRWLPKTLGEEETRALVIETISELDVAGDEKAAGRVTGHLMKNRGGDLDGALVNRIVREELAAG
jgi:uncharacterized protein YqeY